MKKILIYLENENNTIKNVSFELITKAKELVANYNDFEIIGVLITNSCDYEKLRETGLDRLIYCKTSNLNHYSTIEYSKIFTEIIQQETPEIVFIGATNQGRDLAPRVASKLQTGLTADCTELEISGDAKLIATRPTFGGSLMAQIMCKTKPQMATVRPNVFKYIPQINNKNLVVEEVVFDYVSDVIISNKQAKSDDIINLNDAQIILAGGYGLKNKENFDLLKQLAKKIGAYPAGTRKAVEKEFIEKKYQVGQTGQTVAPKIYFALGISGAIQHTSGIENSEIIVAVNNDKNAPIHKIADYSIYEDAQTFIKNWLNQ